ncbi:MAG: hypothetical protein NVSMB7_01590 [Chitinophagaceae bacterium]
MILRFILFALGIYIIYKVLFELVIPVFRATQKIRQQFGAMQEQGNSTQNGYSNQPKSSAPAEQKKPVKAGDYIDFEEVK